VRPFSIFIIAMNEVDRLGATLEAAAGLSDDVVVVDSGSLDGTQDLARRYGARVLHHAWIGYGPQKRFAEDQCRHDWVLNLDADEVLSPRLVQEIRRLFEAPGPQHDAYTLRIAEVFPGENDPHPWAYVLEPVRLYKRSLGRYNPSPVHDRVDLNAGARVGHLKGLVHHFSVRSLGEQMAKLNAYSDAQVDDLIARGKVIPAWRLLTEFPLSYAKALVLRRHFLRGLYGHATAMNYAFSRHLRVAKFIERQRVEALRRRRDRGGG
jgi:glycosyltransferase involved in cell wall biosynthesis